MKVRELLEKLREIDPESEVTFSIVSSVTLQFEPPSNNEDYATVGFVETPTDMD